MGDILRKIEEIEYEMSKTQKNKATAGHLGMLKAKLAKLRRCSVIFFSLIYNLLGTVWNCVARQEFIFAGS